MKKIFVCAVFALGLSVPGMAESPVCAAYSQSQTSITYDILKAAAAQSEYSYGCLCALYDDGQVQIDKLENGTYRVTVQEADGGGGIMILILDENL